MEWTLANVEERHRENPDTFEIPALARRQALEQGDHAKLVFEFERLENGCNGERMWVRVTDIVALGRYVGVLDNKPALIDGLALGAVIEFGVENIASIHSGGNSHVSEL